MPGIVPVFVTDIDTLKAMLRLSNVNRDDAVAMLESAIRDVRVKLYDKLTSGVVNSVVAILHAENPSTPDEIRRAKAEGVEVKMVRVELMRTMPSFFLDSLGTVRRQWNEEGSIQPMDHRSVERMIGLIEAEIDNDIAAIIGSVATDSSSIRCSTIDPDEDPPLPGTSVVPYATRRARGWT